MPVLRILHRAGNTSGLLSMATHPAVDAIEADMWVHGDHLYAHHERPLWHRPFVVSNRGPRILRRPVPLEAILDAVEGHARFVVDLRTWFGDPAPQLVRAIASVEDTSHVMLTCEDWTIADRAREWLPGLWVGYSIRSERQLQQYLAERDAGTRSETPVVVRHTLLTSPEIVEALRRRSTFVGAWTVDDVDRAQDLARWGVDSVTSNLVTVLNAL
jgi:glycerophosphoryl diester phosphodiesterase